MFEKLKDYWNNPDREILSAEQAYTIYAINKKSSLDDIYNKYKYQILDEIKTAARNNNSEIYIQYPYYLTKEQKTKFIEELKELGYNILYSSLISAIINWKG